MLGCAGSNDGAPGENAKRLAQIICATVVAGELSLLAAQCSNDLVQSHMKLNRSAIFFPTKPEMYNENMKGSQLLDPSKHSKTAERFNIHMKSNCMTNIL